MDDEFSSNSSSGAAGARAASPAERAAPAPRANAGLAAAVMDAFAPPPAATRELVAPASAVPNVPAPEVSRASSAAESTGTLRTGVPTTAQPPRQPPASIAAPAAAATGGQNAARPVLFPPRPMIPGSSSGAPSRPLVAPRAAAPTAPAPAQSGALRPSGGVGAPASPASAPVRASAPAPSAPNPAAPSAASVGGASPAPTRTPINPFLANDPHAKAKRLARALVSDLVTYFPQKRQDGLRDGTLKQLFKEEIQKSYEEYVAQVGKEFAESTPHFQDALNDLLAGGQKVF